MGKRKKTRELSLHPEAEDYEVEAIRKARITLDKNWEYLIKWSGFSEVENSWEPETHLSGCLEMLQSFWSQVNPEIKSQVELLPAGFEVIGSKSTNHTFANLQHKNNTVASTAITQSSSLNADPSSKPSPPKDDLPLGNYSDPDDIPLSQLQTLRTFQISREEPEPTESERLFSEPEDNAPLSFRVPKPNNSISLFNIPEHRKRRLQPKVKSIDVVEDFQAISTKSRIARRGSGLTASAVAGQGSMSSPVSPESLRINADQWLNDTFQNVDSPIVPTPVSALPTFNKRWKWFGVINVGDNELESNDGIAEFIGHVEISDHVSGDTSQKDLTMKLLLPSSVESLCFRHSYCLTSLSSALSGFRLAHFARMTASSSTDGNTQTRMEEDNSFPSFVDYMTRNRIYSSMAILAQTKEPMTREVATMFIVPASMRELWEIIKLPEKLRQDHAVTSLLVIVGMHPKGELRRTAKIKEDHFWESKGSQFTQSYLLSSPDLGAAVIKLKFPEQLLKRVSGRHKYAIYTGSASSNRQYSVDLERDLYTRALELIMNKLGAEKLHVSDGEARIIFIHVGAWRLLHKLLGLVDRRLRRLDVEFFTYGADPTVERRFWGVQPVFPIGGLVTFTSQSIIENPEGAEKLIGKLHENHLWNCYIHPAVISMLAMVLKSDAKAVTEIKTVASAHRSLDCVLRAIEKEQLELMWQPPSPYRWREVPSRNSSSYSSSRVLWRFEQERLSKLPCLELISECERRFPAENYTEKSIENLLVNDMNIMQSEYRKERRRFVVITGIGTASNATRDAFNNGSASSYELKDMFEFTHIDTFKFDEESAKFAFMKKCMTDVI